MMQPRHHDSLGPSDFDRLGGPQALRAIMTHLVDHMVKDVMIGFFFDRVDRNRLLALEIAYAKSHLTGTPYRGRDIGEAHAAHSIARGHFARRLQLLAESLAWAGVPEDVQGRWLLHQQQLLPRIVGGSVACPEQP